MFEIHPSAEKNFNSKVMSLIETIDEIPREEQSTQKFETQFHIGAHITGEDIIGEPREAATDYRGNTVGRFFICEGKRYGIENHSHIALVEIAETIQRLPAFRDRLSQKFIEEKIFDWLKNSFINKKQDQDFIDYLVDMAHQAVEKVTVYVPIANTVVQSSFIFGDAEICTITKQLVDEVASIGKPISNKKEKEESRIFFDKFRKDYQGYAAVKASLECEPNYANDLAVTIAQRVTSFLGIYSGAMLIPDIKCISKIKGTENLAQSTTISYSGTNKFSIQHSIIDSASCKHWYISEKDLNDYAQCGLGVISKILAKDKPTEFESLILNTSILYSKAAFTAEPLDKLVYILSALESTLLKNESEPIQQNLAERLAVFSSQELAERKSIIKSVKAVYGLRSRYLHHGHTSSELETLSYFFLKVWVFYIKLLGVSQTFSDKSKFLEALDDHKLG